MNEENFLTVRRIGLAVRDGLGPYVLAAYKFTYTKKKYLEVLQETLKEEHPFDSYDEALEFLDLQAWLNAMEFKWNDVFRRKLGHNAPEAKKDTNVSRARSFVNELRNTRNLFSHEAPKDEFTDEDVHRIADTATGLLKAVKAREQAVKSEEIRLEFGRKLYSAEASEPESEPEKVAPAAAEDQPPEPLAQDHSEETDARVDLSGVNLSGMDLQGRNLHLAKLEGADLSGSNLDGEHLVNLDLSNVDLSKANLQYAKLTGSNLSLANLSEARLGFANLTDSNLSHAKMGKADLRESKIDGADVSYADLTAADLSNSVQVIGAESIDSASDDFDRLYNEIGCFSVNLSHAILVQANMRRTLLEDVNLIRADMTGADFTGARIAGGKLTGATLSDANLSKCEILSCDFSGAKMERVIMSGVSYCVHSIFANADMSGANLEDFTIPEDNIHEEYHWDNVNLSEANLSRAVLPNQSFRNANLTGASFKDAYLVRANFSNADLKETDFTDADLTCADFTGARFYHFSTILPDCSYWDEDTDMTKFTGPLDNC